MIQELLGSLVEDRKISISSPHTQSSASSSPASSASTEPIQNQNQQPQQNLRCPRCDSSNTKFCYYNNYNLTQPRHFCKTCRRYWTKGGALRNVPIGGGCRKSKAMPIMTTPTCIATKSSAASMKILKQESTTTELLARSGLISRVDNELLASSPVLWASPHTSHLMALLRANAVQNTSNTSNINLNSMLASSLVAEPTASLSSNNLSFDHFSQLPLNANSLLKGNNNNQYSYLHHHREQQQQQQHSNNIVVGDQFPSSGVQEQLLYQRLKTSNYNYSDQLQTMVNSVGSLDHHANCCSSSTSVTATATMSTSTTTSIMEPLPLGAGECGYWNPAMSWTDLPTTNGAFP